MAAGKTMLDRADELYAVRDGQPARGYGGTGERDNLGEGLRLA